MIRCWQCEEVIKILDVCEACAKRKAGLRSQAAERSRERERKLWEAVHA